MSKSLQQLNEERKTQSNQMTKTNYSNRCHCTPKPDEWYNDRLCIDCNTEDEEFTDFQINKLASFNVKLGKLLV